MYAKDFVDVSCEHLGESIIELPPDENSFHSFFNHPPFIGNALHIEQVPDMWDQKLRPNPRHATILRALRCMQDAERQRASNEHARITKENVKLASKAAKLHAAVGEQSHSVGSAAKKVSASVPAMQRSNQVHHENPRNILYAVSGRMLQQGVVNGAMLEVSQCLRDASSAYVTSDNFPHLLGLRQKTPFPKGILGAHRRIHQPQLYEYSHAADDEDDNGYNEDFKESNSQNAILGGQTPGTESNFGSNSAHSSPRTMPGVHSNMAMEAVEGNMARSHELFPARGTPPVTIEKQGHQISNSTAQGQRTFDSDTRGVQSRARRGHSTVSAGVSPRSDLSAAASETGVASAPPPLARTSPG